MFFDESDFGVEFGGDDGCYEFSGVGIDDDEVVVFLRCWVYLIGGMYVVDEFLVVFVLG